MINWDSIAEHIGTETQQRFRINGIAKVGGGCINQAFNVGGSDGRRYFVKINTADRSAMFNAEAAGLALIAQTNTITVPHPVVHGIAGRHGYIVLEHLQLASRGDDKLLGRQLAALHRCEARQFGNSHDNFIGSTPQPNGWTDDWVTFWREHRLGFQLQLAERNGFPVGLQARGRTLMDALPDLFDSYQPQPALLHGDLWSGNHAFAVDGTPVIFDPAAYYGDREADLAMTELFGGFSPAFYAAYGAAYPLHDGYRKRVKLYNLYHILNHANLFGGGYARQAEQMTDELLRDL